MIPFFIAGCDRSGTTLLASLLGNHPDCIAIPETHFFTDALAEYKRSENGRFIAEEFLNSIVNHWRFKIWNMPIDPEQQKKLIESTSPEDLLHNLIYFYTTHTNNNKDVHFWIDHTPSNIRYCSTLLNLFPAAKFVHLIRDGRAVCNSVLPLDWGPETVTEAAKWWNKKVAYGLTAESKFEEKVRRLHYETLVKEPHKTIERIISFLGLEKKFDLNTKGFDKPEYTKQQHSLIGQPISERRASAWKHEMSKRDIETFEYHTSELLSYLGYDMHYGISARPPEKPSLLEKVRLKLKKRRKKKLRKKRISNSIKIQAGNE